MQMGFRVSCRENRREEGAAYSCPFSGEGRFVYVYIGKLLKVQRIPEAYSLDLILKETVCIMRFLNSGFFYESKEPRL